MSDVLTGASAKPEEQGDTGLLSWVASVDHKLIGKMYIYTALVFMVIGGIEALLMRIQLAVPRSTFLTPHAYNQIFTMHGTTMIFLVVMPVLIGFANYLVPLMIGARDVAFPRLNAFGFWMLLFGGVLLYYSFLAGGAPDAGWFSYTPLSEEPYSSGPGLDYWIVGLLLTGIGTVTAGLNFIVTIFSMRAPGMSISRLPLFVWMMLVTSFLIIFALPALNAGLVMLFVDRILHGHFFGTNGSPVLWQHYFWAFGHPEVYIMALPAFGMISEVIPVFSRKPIFGYGFVAASTLAIGFLSFGVWVHHMFAVPLGNVSLIAFGSTSMLIAVPTGVKIFNWMATMWGGRIRFATAMMFATAFLVQFTIGGLSGVAFAAVPIDWQLTDTYFVVAHFHYVLFGGSLFGIMAGGYYWFPKMSGRMLDERLGRWNFWTLVLGFNMTFGIQHILGLIGMPRRVFTYPALPGWGWMNMLSTVGAFIMGASILLTIANVLMSVRKGKPAEDNPWEAWTLEWATTSPPPHDNFEQLPPIRSRRPLWDDTYPDQADYLHPEGAGLDTPADPRGFTTMDRVTMFMWLFIASEATFFIFLIIAYAFFHTFPANGPTSTILDPGKTLIFTAFLLGSSITLWLGEKSLHRGSTNGLLAWLVVTILMGGVFLGGQATEYWNLITKEGVDISRNVFATSFFTLTGLHGLHVLLGLIALIVMLILTLTKTFKPPTSRALNGVAMYWHFVDVVWIFIFSMIYLVLR